MDKQTLDIKTIASHFKDNQADRDFVNLKLAEECSELSSQLIQKVLHPFHTSDNSEIIDELGDVLVRFLIRVELLTDEEQEQLKDRVESKIAKSLKRIEYG